MNVAGSGLRQSGRKREPRIPVLQTPSAFHPHAQHNAFRRDARQQSRLFAPLESIAETQPKLEPPEHVFIEGLVLTPLASKEQNTSDLWQELAGAIEIILVKVCHEGFL